MKFPFLSVKFPFSPINFPCQNHEISLQIFFLFGDFSETMAQAAHQQLVYSGASTLMRLCLKRKDVEHMASTLKPQLKNSSITISYLFKSYIL
jgi:hypothetical protein